MIEEHSQRNRVGRHLAQPLDYFLSALRVAGFVQQSGSRAHGDWPWCQPHGFPARLDRPLRSPGGDVDPRQHAVSQPEIGIDPEGLVHFRVSALYGSRRDEDQGENRMVQAGQRILLYARLYFADRLRKTA